jgi:hypothetical protein
MDEILSFQTAHRGSESANYRAARGFALTGYSVWWEYKGTVGFNLLKSGCGGVLG